VGVPAVSILVFVELALDASIILFKYVIYLVSILVFVELALDETNGTISDQEEL